MRITTGQFKGKKLIVPEGESIRPTSDRARQAIFNILSHGKPAAMFHDAIPRGLKILDLFCGSGALGLESLSRGADYAAFVDLYPNVAKSNAMAMKAMDRCDFMSADCTNLPTPRDQFDLVFLDPPYRAGLITPAIQQLLDKKWLAKPALLVIETGNDEILLLPDDLELLEHRQYGAAKIWFYRHD